MIAQYTQAAMVAENRRLAVPASTDTLPTSAMQEDHVSLGWSAARKLRTAVANLGRILAVELTAASWGLRPASPAAAGRRHGGRGRVRCSAPPADLGRTSGWPPAWRPSSTSSPTGRIVAAADAALAAPLR